MANRYFNQFQYSFHKMPVLISCNFIVDHTNGNGLGIRSLKGQGVSSVFMNTSQTPAAGSPNPAAGYIAVKLQDNYNKYLYGGYGLVSPLSGSNIAVDASDAALTAGIPYVITVVGTTTIADWITLGVPVGVVPAVGVSFVAKATGAGAGNGQVQLAKVTGSGLTSIEVVGDPNQSVAPTGVGAIMGSSFILQCLAATNSSTTTLKPTAPADGTIIALQFMMSNHGGSALVDIA